MAAAGPSDKEIVEAFKTFPFATDQEYQTGLQSILASDAFNNNSSVERENMLRLSRVFYFNKVTGNSITLEDALIFESEATRFVSSDHLTDQRQAVREEAHILTFAELKALIEQGKTDGIPNNKLIPNILSAHSKSEVL